LSTKNIQVVQAPSQIMDTGDECFEGMGDQTPFVVYGATGSEFH